MCPKQKDRQLRRSLRNPIRRFDQAAASGSALSLPAPAQQTHHSEAAGEQRENGGKRALFREQHAVLVPSTLCRKAPSAQLLLSFSLLSVRLTRFDRAN
jgi:hypothetical protein